MNQMAVWNKYCTLSTPELILSGLFSRTRDEPWSKRIEIEHHPWNILGESPLAPRDSYPERMVICQWIPDRRRRVFLDKSSVVVAPPMIPMIGGGQQTSVVVGDKDAMPPLPPLLVGADNAQSSSCKLYIRRNLLEKEYDPDKPVYVCNMNGNTFDTYSALKFYTESKIHLKEGQQLQKDRQERLEELDACIGQTIEKPHPPVNPLKKGEKKPPKRKKGKIFPGHIVFNHERSSIYPQVSFCSFSWLNSFLNPSKPFAIFFVFIHLCSITKGL
jgi:hypothetical protein